MCPYICCSIGSTRSAWGSIIDIPAEAREEAFAMIRDGDGDIRPSEEYLAAARRDVSET